MKIRDVKKMESDIERELEHLEENLRAKNLLSNNPLNTIDNSTEISELEGQLESKKHELENIKKVLDIYSELREKINQFKSMDSSNKDEEIDNYLTEFNDKIGEFSDEYKEAFASSITDLESLKLPKANDIMVNHDNENNIVKDIDYYKNQIKVDEKELQRLVEYRDGINKSILSYPASEEEKNYVPNMNEAHVKQVKEVEEKIKKIRERISKNKKIVNSYDSAIKQVENIRWLYRSKINNAKDQKIIDSQIEARRETIKNDICDLPDNLKADILDYVKKIDKEEKSIQAKKELPQEKNTKHEKNVTPSLPEPVDKDYDTDNDVFVIKPDRKPEEVTSIAEPIITNQNQVENKNKQELKGKKWRKALAGAAGFAAGVGLNVVAGSVPVVGAALTVYAAGRTLYNTAKLVNNISTKLNNGEKPKVISGIEKKIPESVKKACIAIFEKPKTENEYAKWFVNGMSIGYLTDKVFDISGHIGRAFDTPDAIVSDSTPVPTSTTTQPVTPIDNPTNTINIGDSIDISNAEYGYVNSLGDGYTHLVDLDGLGKVDQIVNVNGQNMYSILQPNGQGYAWFTEDQVNEMINAAAKTTGKSL